MKIYINRQSFTKRSILFVCFFASMFIFASFTKEDRQKVRSFKLRMMDMYVYHSTTDDTDSTKSLREKNNLQHHSDITRKTDKGNIAPNTLLNTVFRENNLDNIFDSEEKQGTIGEFSDDESDNVSDNFFTINIPEIKKQNIKAYLVYDLFGLDSYHSVSRSINKNIAFGGNIIVASSKWSTQREEISLGSLEKGKNTILFTSSFSGVKYKVKNVKIVFENNLKSSDNISSLLSGNNLYIKGVENGSFNIRGKSVSSVKGEYETLVELTDTDKAKGFVAIIGSNGVREYKIPENKTSFKTLSEEKFAPLVINISKDTEHTEVYENSTLKIEKNSVENNALVQVLKLRKKDYPAISREIKLMTVNSNAYRLENRSGEFTKNMIFSFPYDEKKLGARSAKELKAFYFDYTAKRWKVDPTSKVDTEKKVVTVETKGDTDYINGVISVPESSQLEAFASTSISGLKAADPTSGLQLMGVPTATQKGDASADYPIRVPAGLGGLQPSLSIGYNSGGGNGWMGDGWNINGLSSITVDTRWGVPVFDTENGGKETELYSLDGEMLVYPNGYLPHRHNDVSETNTAITTDKQLRSAFTDPNNSQVKKFYLRKNHNFTLIERIGTSPSNYTWKVTSTDGTKRYYGGSPDSMLFGSGGIAHWGLRLIEDVHGNTMKYTYYNESAGGGQFFQIKKIEYGKGYDYIVNFNRETSITRKDISINAKQGFARAEPFLLKEIEVKYKTELVRTYKMDYIDGEFYKTLLKRIYIVPNNPCSTTLAKGIQESNSSEESKSIAGKAPGIRMDDGTGGGGGGNGGIEPTCNEISDSYTFEYYDDVKDGSGSVKLFGADTPVNLQNDKNAYSGFVRTLINPSKINGNITSETGSSVRIAAGLNFFYSSSDPYGHLMFGFPWGNSTAKARNAQQLVDFNGDGIQDMIYRVPDDGLFLRTGKLDDTGNLSFNGSLRIENYTGGDFSYTETKTKTRGHDMGATVYSHSNISSDSKGSTKTYLIDANSDGLMDIVNNGEVWFNKYNTSTGKSEMTKHSEYTENMVVKAKAIDTPIKWCGDIGGDPYPCPAEPEGNPDAITDVIKVWIAPKDGYVKFTDRISISSLFTPVDNLSQYMYYSVEIKNPTPVSGTTDTFANTRIFLKRIKITDPFLNVTISRYNDYYGLMQTVPIDDNYGLVNGINNSDRLFVKSGEKIYVRLHKNTEKDVPVYSNPMVTYVDENTGNDIPNTYELSQDQFQLNNGNYGSNFLLNNVSSPIYLDTPGTATINIPSITFPSLTDEVKFRIVTENAATGALTNLITQEIYNQSNLTTQAHTINLTVNNGEPVYLRFIVESDSHTNFLSANWNGKITVNYHASISPTNIIDVDYFGIPEYPSFVVTKLKPKFDIFSVPNTGMLGGSHDFGVQINKNIISFSNLGTGSFYYVIKKGNQVIGKRRVTVSNTSTSNILIEKDMATNQEILGISPIDFYTGFPATITWGNDQLVTIQVYCKTTGDYALFNNYSEYFQGNPFNIYYDNANMYGTTSATSVNTAMYNTKSLFYNNWGQFLYKPGDFYNYLYGSPIGITDFSEPVATQNIYSGCLNPNTVNDHDALVACILSATPNPNVGNNSISQTISPMKVLFIKNGRDKKEIWVGSGPDQYSSALNFNTDETVNFVTDPVPVLPTVTPTTYTSGQLSVDTTMKAISRDQRSESNNQTDGLSLGSVSGGNSETTLIGVGSVETQTFSDMNGDGYPDIVYPQSMQFTNSTGSLENVQLVPYSDYPTNSKSYQKSNSAGFSYNTPPITGRIGAHGENGTSTETDTGMPWAGSASVGASINSYFNSYDLGEGFWMDINGDGLPDRIRGGNTPYMRYALNLGKSLAGDANFENLITYQSHPKVGASISLGAGLGASTNMGALASFGFGISAGVSASGSIGSADVVYEDVNGDGLIDILEVNNSSNATTVRYNLGNKFTTAVPLIKSGGDIDFTDETRSYNGSLSLGASYMFNIGPIPLIPPAAILTIYIKAGGGMNINLGLNVSETKKAFKDMNGDGFTDLVEDTGTGFIVNYSQVGRTNKLKTITNSFSKGTYLLDYQFARANYSNPHAKLIVKNISILEPDVFSSQYTTGQGTRMVTQYAFENRKYDRREREDFGFGTVIRQEMNNGSAERTSKDYYFNNSYLMSGLTKQSTVQDNSGNFISDIVYKYKLRKFKNNITEIDLGSDLPFDYDSGGTEGRKMATAMLDEKVNTTTEAGGSIITTEKFSYTPQGLISKYQYTSPSTSYNSNITYQAINNNIIGVPTLIEVYEGTTNSQLLRKRRAYNINWNTGDVATFAVFDGANESVTDVQYNNVGNVTKVTYPPSNSTAGGRYWMEYTYDDAVTGKYVTQVKDIFDIKSTAIYNPLFDVVTRKVDTGGNAMVFTYDGFGRTRSIMGPNEIASGSTVPTVKYNYWLDHAGIANNDAAIKIYRASTSNFDPEYASSNNTIMTDTYSDFLGRIIQVKKDIEMYGYESRSVSGRAIFDGLGRIVRQYHPTTEGLTNQNLNSSSLGGPFTSSVYDSRDRVVSATNEDGVVTTTTYAIDSDLFRTTQEILNEKSESFTNAEGKIVQKDDYLDNDPLSTFFKYNTIGELVKVTDPEGIATQYSYDLAGRRTQQVHPDKGMTRYEYDSAGNLLKLTTDNLLNDPTISNNYIFYKYDYNRLVGIVLPDLPSGDPNPNNVTYQYGSYTSGNNAGKLIYKEDGSGNIKYTYGRMGEILTELRTVIGYNIPEMYFKTIFNHDSWNRVTKIKYPDDEIVSYHYDKGGNLKTVNNDQGETYIQNINYDNYEQRTNIAYGNGTSQDYGYDMQNRRLINYNLYSPGGNPMLQNVYKYDEFSNIKGIKNMAYPQPNGMGGAYEFSYGYDTLNRLIGTETTEKILNGEEQPIQNTYIAPSTYKLEMQYNKVGGIVKKAQHHERDLIVVPENTYENNYAYVDTTHKLDKVDDSNTGNVESFEYDYNGNAVMHNDINGTRKMFWDEQDRMRAFYNDNTGVYQYHTYDDKGERVIRYGLEAPAQLYQNGAPVIVDDLKMIDYKIYPSPYVTVSSTGQYTKHYFEGSKRFASRLLDGAVRFEDPSILYSSKMADQKAPEKKADTEADFKKYLEQTDLGNNVSVELREVMQRPNLYYLHGDHLGTATFVTNSQGYATQFFLNLPFGETMLEQMDGSYNNPYKFNAKELDEDIGLYYYGARYYNPRLSIWYGVDPLGEKMPSWSPFSYTFDNPIIYTDPTGKAPTDIFIIGDYADRAFAQLKAATNGQLELSIKDGKVSAIPVAGVKLTKDAQLFLKATTDECNIMVVRTDGDYTLPDSNIPYVGGAYMGSKMLGNGKMKGVNVVNPMVMDAMDQLYHMPEGVGTYHDTLEGYEGILSYPGSPPATTEENKKLGYNQSHSKVAKLDKRFKDNPEKYNGKLKIGKENGVEKTQEYIMTDKKTGKENSFGKFKIEK